ncbi:SDR family oxidoreductase [Sutcliffiella rhizosphaerae]|uniref:3-oxoacyl-[acyl-carrier-protein] reductase FabG n=1 Tax=Sutcliffiella rhizosphaerae TaxID=2880967 RepID=A0ABN8A3A7_9BACI|nr:SDR family oxidoreductase [Sutcliffiella rhizosphaerae]CAG9619629.1 3-oxoacyl-[acyl-carrier-protein] reductase FabG [Sutcliffiella rhizosphaerae]
MRHAVITAGSKGLGKKVTDMLLAKGCSVTVNFRNDTEAIDRIKSEWSHIGNEHLHFFQGDVTKKENMEGLINDAIERFGRIDYLINNAGPYIFERKKLADYSDEEWYEMLEGNLSAVFHLFRKTIPVMRAQQFGRIITYGFQGAESSPGWIYRSAFAAAKVGLVSLTKSIAIEEAENGITANMVCPGNIVGEMKEAGIDDAKQLHDNKGTPVGRSGTGEDIARAIGFLCEDHSDLITGAVLEVTGGVEVINRLR